MKRASIIKLAVLFLAAITLQSCPMDMVYTWAIENNSDHYLGVYLALGFYSAYPDTVFPAEYHEHMIAGVWAHNTNVVYSNGVEREKIFKGLPKDTLSISIFNMDSIQNSTEGELAYGKRFLQRYDMSLEDMESLDFTVPYPPTEAMKNMKMYPPYGSR